MDTQALITILTRSPLFKDLPAEAIRTCAEAAQTRVVKKGQTLFCQGDESTHHYIVAWGRLRLDQATPDGKNIVLRFIGEGDLVGSVAVLRGIPYPATTVAVEDTTMIVWSAPRMLTLMQTYPILTLHAMNIMGGRIEELQGRMQEIATQQVERRIAAAILRIANQSGRRVDAGVEIPFPISRQDLAELTGTTLHTVSRTLSAWIEQGLLDGRRSSHLTILRPHRLVEISEQA